MEIYLVGGAVRDRLLGLAVHEKDYVVVGATDHDMRAKGFRQVGSDFPVYLHPETSEEYALARTERKIAPGHQGFECRSDPEVTLEEDLLRRDLTINAIAESIEGQLIDPFGGQADLDAGIIRHVSEAFTEDPLRILRIARFKARFHHLGFSVHPETTALLEQMVAEGLHRELTPERVLMELDKALITPDPAEFFKYLDDIGAASDLWPEVTTSAVKRLGNASVDSADGRFALLLMDQNTDLIRALCRRLKTSNERTELTILVAEYQEQWLQQAELSAIEVVDLILRTDGLRKSERFLKFNAICIEISGITSLRWLEVLDIMAGVKARDLDTQVKGPQLGELVREEQVRRVAQLL